MASYFLFWIISGAIYKGDPQRVSANAWSSKDLRRKEVSTLHSSICLIDYNVKEKEDAGMSEQEKSSKQFLAW